MSMRAIKFKQSTIYDIHIDYAGAQPPAPSASSPSACERTSYRSTTAHSSQCSKTPVRGAPAIAPGIVQYALPPCGSASRRSSTKLSGSRFQICRPTLHLNLRGTRSFRQALNLPARRFSVERQRFAPTHARVEECLLALQSPERRSPQQRSRSRKREREKRQRTRGRARWVLPHRLHHALARHLKELILALPRALGQRLSVRDRGIGDIVHPLPRRLDRLRHRERGVRARSIYPLIQRRARVRRPIDDAPRASRRVASTNGPHSATRGGHG